MPVTSRDIENVITKFEPFIKGSSDILIIGDTPTKDNIIDGKPFTGNGAKRIAAMLMNIGVNYYTAHKAVCLDYWPSNGDGFSETFSTKTKAAQFNAVPYGSLWITQHVKDCFEKLDAFIDEVKPRKILALGGFSLFALTGETSISSWRGSILRYVTKNGYECVLLPTYNPVTLERKQSWAIPLQRDLYRFKDDNFAMPEFDFLVRGTFDQYKEELDKILFDLDHAVDYKIKLAVDIETQRLPYMTVCGIATSKTKAIVIPFVRFDQPSYFTVDEEFEIVKLLKKILTHENAIIRGQNFQFDLQYFVANYGIKIHFHQDTMVMAHAIWTKNLELNLGFLASMYCDWYRYWKDDGKDFHRKHKTVEEENKYWLYNGYDCCYTFEVADALEEHWEHETDLRKELLKFQTKMQNKVVEPVLRGIRFDRKKQFAFGAKLDQLAKEYEDWFEYMIPNAYCSMQTKSPWWNSPTKLANLLYKQWGIDPVIEKKRPTTGGKAPSIIGEREPLLKLVMKKLDEYRSIEQYRSLYIAAEPSPSDGRMRTQYMLPGTDTFRLASKKDAFGYGMNLQNITKGD